MLNLIKHDAIAEIQLARPPVNALNLELLRSLRERGGEVVTYELGPQDRPVDVLFLHANGFNARTYRTILAPLATWRRTIPDISPGDISAGSICKKVNLSPAAIRSGRNTGLFWPSPSSVATMAPRAARTPLRTAAD